MTFIRKHRILTSVVMNAVLPAVYVTLTRNALVRGYEETFVSLAVYFGISILIANALHVAILRK